MPAATIDKSLNPSSELLADLPADLFISSEVHLRLLKLVKQNTARTQHKLADALRISLGKANCCRYTLKNKGLIKWKNFSQNPERCQYMPLITTKGATQKLRLTTHFLYCKEREFEVLRRKTTHLFTELGTNNPSPNATRSNTTLGETKLQGQAPMRQPRQVN
jgi:hypothetical protein